MTADLRIATTVLYVDDVAAAVEFYRAALGWEPRYYDEALGFAELGEDKLLSLASAGAGELMMPGAYDQHGKRVSAVEVAFFTDDVPAAFERAVSAGAVAMTPPRVMPWGQTVAYARAPEGTILGFVTQVVPADPG